MKDIIKKLTECFGPSGYEAAVRACLTAELPKGVESRVDAMGNLIVHKPGKGSGGRKVMVAAHMDEIGVIVTHVDQKGFLRFGNVGGVRLNPLMGGRVRFANGTIGVIGMEKVDDASRLPALEKFYIDVGATSPGDCPVRVGDVACFHRVFEDLGTRMVAKAMDDRVGCAVILQTLKELGTTPNDLYFVFTVQEEVGLRGAATSGFGVEPDIAVAVDVTLTGDTPECPPMAVALGAGPTVKIKDGGMLAHVGVKDWLIRTAEVAGIAYQREVLVAGTTDACAIQVSRAGVPSGCVSIPTRFVHMPSEVVDFGDVEGAVKLLGAALKQPIDIGDGAHVTPTVGVGIIGYGFIGKVHAYAYRTIPFHYDPIPLNARLVAVATSHRETAEAARAHGGFESCTDDWRALIAMPEIQIVHICSPTGAHVDQLEAALNAGKHIYCEKPIVSTVEEAARVRRALVGWHGIGQMTFHNRFYSAAQKARQLVDKGFLGTPLGFRGVYLHAGNIDPGTTMKWRLRKSAGGGVLRDLGAHLLDLLEFLAGPIDSISASPRTLHAVRPDGRGGMETVDVEDQICMTARLASGAVGTLEASKIATGAEDDLRLEIEGTRGALRFNVMEPDFLETYSRDDPDTPLGGERGWKKIAVLQRYPAPAVFPSTRATSGWLRGHVHCLHNFLSAVAAGAPAEPSLERGLHVQDLIQTAEMAGATGLWQTVAPR